MLIKSLKEAIVHSLLVCFSFFGLLHLQFKHLYLLSVQSFLLFQISFLSPQLFLCFFKLNLGSIPFLQSLSVAHLGNRRTKISGKTCFSLKSSQIRSILVSTHGEICRLRIPVKGSMGSTSRKTHPNLTFLSGVKLCDIL